MTCKLEITAYASIVLADCHVSFFSEGGRQNPKVENLESGLRKVLTTFHELLKQTHKESIVVHFAGRSASQPYDFLFRSK